MKWVDKVSSVTHLANSKNIIKWNTDKHYLKELAARGISIAPMVWLEKGDKANIKQIITDLGWKKGFIKPIFG